MRIGIYLDMRNPPAWRRDWVTHYRRSLELVEEADRLGADSVWLSEHHFFEDGYLPQPMTFAAAIAARTSRIRIGTAVLIAPLRPAVEIAEEAAIVDILSAGRLELGLGAGYREPEFLAYGVDISRRIATTHDRVRQVRRLLDTGGVMPPPVQERIPIWVGHVGPKGAYQAGLTGEGLLCIDPRLTPSYLLGRQDAGHPRGTARMAGLANIVVADDPDRTWDRLEPYFRYQLDSYSRYAVEGSGTAAPNPPDMREFRVEHIDSPVAGVFPNISVFTAEETIALLRRRRTEMPIVEAFFWASFAGMPDDVVARHVELLCGVVRTAVASDNET